MFEKYIDDIKDEIVSQVSRLIQIPSIDNESIDKAKPFGENANRALEYVLSLGEDLGFRTKNIDGYCGYIEFGEGNDLVGIIGHLDVVPVNDGWTYEPFAGTIRNGNLFGRGAIDDKGPVIASLYAMKAVMDTCKIKKRVRLILGLNEEKDWKCIQYYKEHEEMPTIGFCPDADFPCIYAEKGVLSIYVEDDYSEYQNEPLIIENIDCKGNAINVVPKECTVCIRIKDINISSNNVINYITSVFEQYSNKIKLEKTDDKKITITSYGTASHAAHPELGENAVSRLLVLLYDVFTNYNSNIGILHLFYNFFGMDYYGEKLGLNLVDESGNLTINVGNVSLEKNIFKIGFNIRVPVNTKLSVITDRFLEIANPYKKIAINVSNCMEPLHIAKDNPLVTTLCSIFNKMTGLNERPIAIGGATYARAFDNCVCFGANMPGNRDMCHQVDEFISIDNLILASKIYAEAIYELTK